jgi:hypothetical protein
MAHRVSIVLLFFQFTAIFDCQVNGKVLFEKKPSSNHLPEKTHSIQGRGILSSKESEAKKHHRECNESGFQ